MERKAEDELFKEPKRKLQESEDSGNDGAVSVRRRGIMINVGKYAEEDVGMKRR